MFFEDINQYHTRIHMYAHAYAYRTHTRNYSPLGISASNPFPARNGSMNSHHENQHKKLMLINILCDASNMNLLCAKPAHKNVCHTHARPAHECPDLMGANCQFGGNLSAIFALSLSLIHSPHTWACNHSEIQSILLPRLDAEMGCGSLYDDGTADAEIRFLVSKCIRRPREATAQSTDGNPSISGVVVCVISLDTLLHVLHQRRKEIDSKLDD